jgi:hypothetical protein
LSERVRIKSTILGALVRTWGIFDSYTDDGILHGYDAHTLNEIVGLENWAENLQHIGWLEIRSQTLVMPGFDTWLSSSAKARMKDRERKRVSRKSTSEIRPENVQKSADQKRTTGEERREENKNKKPPKSPKGEWGADEQFRKFWNTYPKQRRQGPKDAYPRWLKAVSEIEARLECHDEAVNFLQSRCEAYAASPLGMSEFAVAPAVWLNQGRYDDEDAAWKRGSENKVSKPKVQGIADPNEEYNPNARF